VKVVLMIGLSLFLQSCTSNQIKPQKVKEISQAQSKRCTFIDDISIERENISEQKLNQQIRVIASKKESDSFLVEERINNGKKIKIIGSLFNCSK